MWIKVACGINDGSTLSRMLIFLLRVSAVIEAWERA
jgi:hypothetical protein